MRTGAMTGPILIIEDDPDIAEILRFSLEREHLRTCVALTGDEGLSASLDKNNPPSLILLDLLLPGMSGIEICRRLRNEEPTSNTPIIIVTAKTSEKDFAISQQLGISDYIIKPFCVREVIARVNSLLNQRQVNQIDR